MKYMGTRYSLIQKQIYYKKRAIIKVILLKSANIVVNSILHYPIILNQHTLQNHFLYFQNCAMFHNHNK